MTDYQADGVASMSSSLPASGENDSLSTNVLDGVSSAAAQTPALTPSSNGSDDVATLGQLPNPLLGDGATGGVVLLKAQPKKAEELPLKGPTTTLNFGNIQTGEKYRIHIKFVATKQGGFKQDLGDIDVSVGPTATVDQIVKNIKAALEAKKVPFEVDPKNPNVITFAWGKGGDKGGDLSQVRVTLFSDVTPGGKAILNMNLDGPKWIGGTGSPEVKVDVNGKTISTLPNKPQREEEEESLLSDDVATADGEPFALPTYDPYFALMPAPADAPTPRAHDAYLALAPRVELPTFDPYPIFVVPHSADALAPPIELWVYDPYLACLTPTPVNAPVPREGGPW